MLRERNDEDDREVALSFEPPFFDDGATGAGAAGAAGAVVPPLLGRRTLADVGVRVPPGWPDEMRRDETTRRDETNGTKRTKRPNRRDF